MKTGLILIIGMVLLAAIAFSDNTATGFNTLRGGGTAGNIAVLPGGADTSYDTSTTYSDTFDFPTDSSYDYVNFAIDIYGYDTGQEISVDTIADTIVVRTITCFAEFPPQETLFTDTFTEVPSRKWHKIYLDTNIANRMFFEFWVQDSVVTVDTNKYNVQYYVIARGGRSN
jgi:hypothetical protein